MPPGGCAVNGDAQGETFLGFFGTSFIGTEHRLGVKEMEEKADQIKTPSNYIKALPLCSPVGLIPFYFSGRSRARSSTCSASSVSSLTASLSSSVQAGCEPIK